MAEVIVITSGKGGVGKTTSTANIGVGLALAGKRVVLVDTDIGLRNLDVVMGLENRIVYNLVDVLERRCRIKQALIRDKRFDGLYLLPASQINDKSDVEPEQMQWLAEELKREFDYILIDCPAGIEKGFKNAIISADRAIIVTTPEVSSVRDADRVIAILEASGLHKYHLLVNRVRQKMINEGSMISVEDVKDILSTGLIGVVPEDEEVIVSTNRGQPLAYTKSTDIGAEYRSIAKRIMGDDIPFIYIHKDKMINKIKKFFTFSA